MTKNEVKKNNKKKLFRNEKGSIALEQVLFVAAIAAISLGVFGFYESIGEYFGGITFGDSPTFDPDVIKGGGK